MPVSTHRKTEKIRLVAWGIVAILQQNLSWHRCREETRKTSALLRLFCPLRCYQRSMENKRATEYHQHRQLQPLLTTTPTTARCRLLPLSTGDHLPHSCLKSDDNSRANPLYFKRQPPIPHWGSLVLICSTEYIYLKHIHADRVIALSVNVRYRQHPSKTSRHLTGHL